MIRRRLPGLLVLVWALSIAISYLIVHQVQYDPLDEEVVMALGRLLLDGMAVVLLLVLSGTLGTLFLLRFEKYLPELEQGALAALLGLGAIGFVILVIGLLGLFPPGWLMWLVMASALAILHKTAVAWLRNIWRALQGIFRPEPTLFIRWIRNGLAILLVLAILLAMAPPTEWDALTYHLAGPRFYLQSERIVSYPQNHFLGFPQGVEMLYLGLIMLARPQAAALLHWCFGVLLLMLVMGLAQRVERPAAGWIAAAALLVSETLWGEFSWPYNDLALMAYTTAGLAVIVSWSQDGERQQQGLLGLAGVFIGLALGTKYTAAGVAVGLGVLVLWLSRRDGLLQIVRAGGMVSVAALIVFAPWMIKNALLDGNPLSPFVWGTSAFDRFDQWYYLRPGTGLNALSLLFAPLQGAIMGSDSVAPYGASSGALVLALLPTAALGWRKRSKPERGLIRCLLLVSLPPYLIWLAGLATSWYLIQMRLLFPIFPALALVGGLGLTGLCDMTLRPDVDRLLRVLVMIVLSVAVLNASWKLVRTDALRVVFGLQSEEAYLEQAMGVSYLAMQQVNELPQDAKVLFLWEPRTFHCERICIPDSLINQWWHERQLEPDPHRIVGQWQEQGVTHVLIADWAVDFMLREEEEIGSLSEADATALTEIRREDMTLLWDGYGFYSLYELKGTCR
ncbi:MAG: phospholipid carrier-dependent glycosyltransferase [Anaerolineae bacterium]|nr:phospholipid carrier-dependent glycosyltransferase [Anaerolineae bacterium]